MTVTVEKWLGAVMVEPAGQQPESKSCVPTVRHPPENVSTSPRRAAATPRRYDRVQGGQLVEKLHRDISVTVTQPDDPSLGFATEAEGRRSMSSGSSVAGK
jgi:hypothetical protein